MNADVLADRSLRRQKKIPDLPAAITGPAMLEKYRAAADCSELRRASVSLPKPRTRERDDPFSRRKSTSSAAMEIINVVKKRQNATPRNETKTKTNAKTSTPGSKTLTSFQYKRGFSNAADAYAINASNVLISAPSSSHSTRSRDSSSRYPMLTGGTVLPEMDFSYLEPFGKQGLFSTSGVSGSKATLSSADGLRSYGSLQDVSGVHGNGSSQVYAGFQMRRTSSVTSIFDDIRAKSQAPMGGHLNISMDKVRETLFNSKRNRNSPQTVSSLKSKRPDNKSPSTTCSSGSGKSSDKKPVSSRSNSKLVPGVNKPGKTPLKTSTQGQNKPDTVTDKVTDKAAVTSTLMATKPRKNLRVVITQTTEDGENEFEVVEYL